MNRGPRGAGANLMLPQFRVLLLATVLSTSALVLAAGPAASDAPDVPCTEPGDECIHWCTDCVPQLPCGDGSCIDVGPPRLPGAPTADCVVVASVGPAGAECTVNGKTVGYIYCRYCVEPMVGVVCQAGLKVEPNCWLRGVDLHVQDADCIVVASVPANGARCEIDGKEYGYIYCEYCVGPMVGVVCTYDLGGKPSCRLIGRPSAALP